MLWISIHFPANSLEAESKEKGESGEAPQRQLSVVLFPKVMCLSIHTLLWLSWIFCFFVCFALLTFALQLLLVGSEIHAGNATFFCIKFRRIAMAWTPKIRPLDFHGPGLINK